MARRVCSPASWILGGTLYKVIALRSGGGIGVAESVGGNRCYPNTGSLHERRLLNVVEEMAIASGTPVPPVYILDEPGINAFAAGYSPDDAVIGVTRGALEGLNREQLQGVIAHEFSHILNGDMRMNIRMIGILHGILLLTLIGKLLFRSFAYGGHRSSRSSNDRGGGTLYILGIALALLIIGSLGSFFGGLIKAAVSRQREYLADASAVQFTRNPNGIGGALKMIGGHSRHGMLRHRNAAEASHMFFAKGVFEGFTGLLATHPPLPKRILAIDPGWNGVFPDVEAVASSASSAGGEGAVGFAGDGDDDAPIGVVSEAAEQIGDPQEHHRLYAGALIRSLDPAIISAVREPYNVRALMFALLLDRDAEIRSAQHDALEKLIEPALVAETKRLSKYTDVLPDRAFLPLVDLALPTLASMSEPQYRDFMRSFTELTRADAKISLFEWTLSQVLKRHLAPRYETIQSPVTQYYGLQKLTDELGVLLTTLARVGHHTDDEVKHAFQEGTGQLLISIPLLPPDQCSLVKLDASLQKLSRSTARLRGQVVDACAATVCADGQVRVREAELLRGIADMLECPVPPLISHDSAVG